ncbi:MAG: VWA domain-containing protein [Acidobacteriota bacterium]|nr:VWA domain-containing protein [Acidobacteriota bacterium]
MNSKSPLKFEYLQTTGRSFLMLASIVAAFLSGLATASAQEVADTIHVKTRVVFMDALVKDKHTGVPISDLKPETFEVLDEGNVRPISYFTREGQARKPLALVLILDLRNDRAGRFLKRPDVLKTVADELAKLSPEDEVAILAMNINGADEKRVWLTGFTHAPAQLVAALGRAPGFIDVPPGLADTRAGKTKDKSDADHGSSLTLGSDSTKKAPQTESAGPGPGTPKSDNVAEVEVIKGKNGAVVTRTIRTDGSVDVKRVNRKGEVTMELGDIYDMAAAVKETIRKTERERPNSQLSIVWVSDGIAPIFFEDRDATEQLVIRSNVIFNSLTVELRTLFKLLMPIGKPIAGMMGVSVYGSAKRLAQQSGGEAVKVSRTKDYAAGLSKIIGNLTARYSLGFQLAESEKDDGQLHNLEVRVKAPDAKGKLRKLEVSSRRGYYMSETGDKESKEAAATKAQ